jgi:hypothetical protein
VLDDRYPRVSDVVEAFGMTTVALEPVRQVTATGPVVDALDLLVLR